MFSYGLASLGPLLWYLGAPAVKVENDLSLEMSLLNQKSGKILFAKKYSAVPISELGWIYSFPDDFRYSEILREVFREFISDLNAEFPSGLKE